MASPVRIIDARTGEIRWNFSEMENAHISYLYDESEIDLRQLGVKRAAEVVEYMAAHESVYKAANACITLTDEEIELLTSYAELNADEASYLRVLIFMLKEGLYDDCVLYLPFTRNLRAGVNDDGTTVYDRSNFGNHGTIYGAVWQTLPSGKSALSFDGVDDYVEVPDSASLKNITDKVTIIVWINPKSYTDADGKESVIVAKVYQYWLMLTSDGGFRFRVYDGTVRFFESPSGIVELNKWQMLAVSFDRPNVKLFRNGEVVRESSTFDYAATPNDEPFRIASWDPVGYIVNGTIDEVRIYNRALSEEEINRLFELTRVFYGV